MIKSLLTHRTIMVAIFAISFGIMAGCGERDSENNDQDGTTAFEQQRLNEDENTNSALNNERTFEAELMGSNEVPQVDTDASGSLTLTLQGDSAYVEGEFSDLSSQYTASHIHKGAKGQNGGPILTLKPTVDPERTSGSWGGSYSLNQSQISALKSDSLYINVHSQQHENGEIRGQLRSSSGRNNR